MSKHTPGPWEPMKSRDGDIRGFRGQHGPETVNVINWNGISRASSPNGQANARLIAAAPELLAALRELLSEAEEGIATCPLTRAWARAAIAAATGENA